MKEIPPHKQPKEKLALLKLEELSNILTKKQVEVMWLALHNKLLTNENHFKRHNSFAELCLMPEYSRIMPSCVAWLQVSKKSMGNFVMDECEERFLKME